MVSDSILLLLFKKRSFWQFGVVQKSIAISISEKLLKYLSHFQLLLCVRLDFLHMLQPKQYLTAD